MLTSLITFMMVHDSVLLGSNTVRTLKMCTKEDVCSTQEFLFDICSWVHSKFLRFHAYFGDLGKVGDG